MCYFTISLQTGLANVVCSFSGQYAVVYAVVLMRLLAHVLWSSRLKFVSPEVMSLRVLTKNFGRRNFGFVRRISSGETSGPRESLAVCWAKAVPTFLGYFKTLYISPSRGFNL